MLRVLIAALALSLLACGSTSPADSWKNAAKTLAAEAQNLEDAYTAGNVRHATEIREQLIKTCRSFWGLKPAGTQPEAAVKIACDTYGARFPQASR